MLRDVDEKLQGTDAYTHALNAVMLSSSGELYTLVSESGTEYWVEDYPSSKKIIGSVVVSDELIVLFLYDPAGEHEIGLYNSVSKKYTTYAKGSCLNFSDLHPINAISRTFASCQVMVYFTDDYNPYRVINVVDESYQKIDPVTRQVDCKSLLFSPSYTVPDYLLDVVNGGSLPAGSYSVAVRYLDANSIPTNWVKHTHYVSISDNLMHQARSIRIRLVNLDTYYPYVQFAVIQRSGVSGAVSATYLLSPIKFDSSSLEYVYQGGGMQQLVSFEEVIEDVLMVHRVKAHTSADNRLILGHLSYSKHSPSVLQRHASAIKTEWEGEKGFSFSTLPVTTLMRDEVYAFGIQYIFKDGSRSAVYHIPGRPAIDNTGNTYGYNDNITSSLDEWDTYIIPPTDKNYLQANQPRWKVYNTYTHYSSAGPFADSSTIARGLMGYYEVSRPYPQIPSCDDEPFFGFDYLGNPLDGTNIRHHRVPDMPLEDYYISPPNVEDRIMRIIPRFTMTLDYPYEDIVGHVYLMADRSKDKTIVDKGLMGSFGMSEYNSQVVGKVGHYNTLTFHASKGLEYPSPNLGPIVGAYYTATSNPPYYDENARVFSLITPKSIRAYAPNASQHLKIEGIYRNTRQNAANYDLSGALQAISQRTWVPSTSDFENLALLSVFNCFNRPNYRYTDRIIFPLEDIKLLEASSTVEGKGALMRDDYVQNSSYNTSIYALSLGLPFTPVATPVPNMPHDFFFKHVSSAPTTSLDERLRSHGAHHTIVKVALKSDTEVFSALEALVYRDISSKVYVKGVTPNFALPDNLDTFITPFEILDYFYFNRFDTLPSGNLSDILPNARKFIVVAHLIQTAIEAPYNEALRLDSAMSGHSNFYPPRKIPSALDETSVARSLNVYLRNKIHASSSSEDFHVYPQLYEYNLSFDYLLPDKMFIPDMPTRCVLCDSDIPNRVYYSKPANTDDLLDLFRIIPKINTVEVPFRYSSLTTLKTHKDLVLAFSRDELFASDVRDQTLALGGGGNVVVQPQGFLSVFQRISSQLYRSAGCEGFLDMVDTPFGLVYVDRLNRSIHLFSSSSEDISAKGMKQFFDKHLVFHLDEQFKKLFGVNYPITSPVHPFGIGLILGWDPVSKRVLITKRDFEIKPEYLRTFKLESSSELWFDYERYRDKQFMFNESPLSTFSKEFFIDKSYTISFSTINSAWVSFHSFKPRWYFTDNRFLFSNDIYRHSSKEHGTFYGKTYPMIVDFTFSDNSLTQITPSSLRLSMAKFYYEPTSNTYVKTDQPLNRLIAYTSNQTSGELTCFYPQGPYIDEPPSQTEVYLVDDLYRVSRFRDMSVSTLFPIWVDATLDEFRSLYLPNVNTSTSIIDQLRLKDVYIGFRLIFDNYPHKIQLTSAALEYYKNTR